MARKLEREAGMLARVALGVLALAGAVSYAQDNPTPPVPPHPPAPPQISSTTKIDVLGSAKPGDGSDTDKAWQSFLQGLRRIVPIAPPAPPPPPFPPPLPPMPVPLGTSGGPPGGTTPGTASGGATGGVPAGMPGGIPSEIQGLLNGILGGNAPGFAPGGTAGGAPAGALGGLFGQIQGLLNALGGLLDRIQDLLNGILGGGPPGGMPGGIPGGPGCGIPGGFMGITSNGNTLPLDAVVQLQSQTTVDLSVLGPNAPRLPAPTLTLRGDVVVTGNNLPLMPSFERTQPHLNANGIFVVVKGTNVYGIGLLFGLSPQDWTGLRKLDHAPLPHLKKVLADGGKPLTADQETALHIDLEEQLVDAAGILATAPGAHDSALDFTRKLFALWQATLGDDPGFETRLQSVLSVDQWALLENTPVVLCAGKPRRVPAIDFTSLSITPRPAIAGQPVTFTVMVVGTDVKVAWDFGDGTTDTSNSLSVTHTYSTPGPYQVTITGSNATKNISRTFCLPVLPADGTTPPGSGANSLALVINTLRALLKLEANALSVFVLSGVLPDGPDALAGAKVDITIGGKTVSFALDNKGKGSNQGSSVQLKARAKRGAKRAGATGGANVAFRAKLVLSQLPSDLLDANSTARSVKKTVALPITIQIDDQAYSTTLAGQYVKNGKKARLSK